MVPVRDNGDLGRIADMEVTRSGQKRQRDFGDGLIGFTDGLDVGLENNFS